MMFFAWKLGTGLYRSGCIFCATAFSCSTNSGAISTLISFEGKCLATNTVFLWNRARRVGLLRWPHHGSARAGVLEDGVAADWERKEALKNAAVWLHFLALSRQTHWVAACVLPLLCNQRSILNGTSRQSTECIPGSENWYHCYKLETNTLHELELDCRNAIVYAKHYVRPVHFLQEYNLIEICSVYL